MITHSAQETIAFARKFAKNLKGGEVIGLIGDLGSGKTVFVKGLAKELKIKENITSPTFVLLKVYKIRAKGHLRGGLLVHIDAYRAESIEDIKSAGIEDFIGRKDTVIVIEWADKIREILPATTIYIKFRHIGESRREISTISAPASKVDKRI